MRHVQSFLVIPFAVIMMTTLTVFATGVPGKVTYQGRIIKPNGDPLEASSVTFTLQVRSPDANDCLLYEETQGPIDMSGSQGVFSLSLGGGTRTDGGAYTYLQAFSNAFDFPGTLTCASGSDYVPGANDVRKLRVTFNDGGGAVALTPDLDIQSVPFALNAETIAGFTAGELLQVNTSGSNDLSQANLESVFTTTNYPKLLALVNGTSTDYLQDASSFSVGATNTIGFGQFTNAQETTLTGGFGAGDAGKTWFNSDTGQMMYWNGSTAQAVGTGTGAVSSVFGRTGAVTAATSDYDANQVDNTPAGNIAATDVQAAITELDNEKLALAGGTMSGTINMNDSNLDMGTGSAKIIDLADPTLAQDAATKNYVDSTISTNNGSFVAKAGDTMSGALAMGSNKITGLGTPTAGTDAATKNYVDSASGNTNYVAVSGDSMTGALAMGTNKITGLGDPTAAQDAVTKTYADGRLLGNTLSAPGGGQASQSIRWNSGGTAWEYYTPAFGTVTSVATGSGLTGGTITSTGTISVATGGITATHLAADSVEASEIAASAVGTSEIANGTVTVTDLNTTSVDSRYVLKSGDTMTGSITAPSFLYTSDRRLKEHIKDVKGLEYILRMRGVRFDWIANGVPEIGLIAQEIEAIAPELVYTNPKTGMKAVKYGNLVSPLIESTKELYTHMQDNAYQLLVQESEITSLKEENERLKAKTEELEERLQRLERLLAQ